MTHDTAATGTVRGALHPAQGLAGARRWMARRTARYREGAGIANEVRTAHLRITAAQDGRLAIIGLGCRGRAAKGAARRCRRPVQCLGGAGGWGRHGAGRARTDQGIGVVGGVAIPIGRAVIAVR